jgi:hypothetical protein
MTKTNECGIWNSEFEADDSLNFIFSAFRIPTSAFLYHRLRPPLFEDIFGHHIDKARGAV